MIPLERADLSARFVVERLRLNVKQQFQQQFPGDHPGPGKWLKLISGVLDTSESYLTASRAPARPLDEKLKLVDDAAALAIQAYNFLDLFRGADVNELPFPVVSPLQRWFDELKLTNTTFFRATVEANYELARIHKTEFAGIRDPAPSLDSAIANVNWPVLRVTVPAKAFGIVPHFAVVAHELGHALYPDVKWDTSSLDPEVHAAQTRVTARLAGWDTETHRIFVSVFNSWFEELSADAFMFFLTGPAGFFALSDVLQLFVGPDGFSPTHPVSAQRREILFSRLATRGAGSDSFADVFLRHTGKSLTEDFNSPLIKRPTDSNYIFAGALSQPEVNTKCAAVMAELYDVMQQAEKVIYPQVEAFLMSRAPDSIYTPSKFDSDLTSHLKPMLVAIPPVEEGISLEGKTPTQFASILNVGWVAVLTALAQLRVRVSDIGDPLAERMERLHSLLLKAVELSEAKAAWDSA